jgi:hypothetical protein
LSGGIFGPLALYIAGAGEEKLRGTVLFCGAFNIETVRHGGQHSPKPPSIFKLEEGKRLQFGYKRSKAHPKSVAIGRFLRYL